MSEAVTRMQIVTEARTWLGTKYHHQASLRGVGCDCVGLHRGVASVLAIPWVHPSQEICEILQSAQWFWHRTEEYFLEVFTAAPALEQIEVDTIQPGDTLVFGFGDRPCSHAGILATSTHFIHALYGKEVRETPLLPHWTPLIRAAFAVKGVVNDLA